MPSPCPWTTPTFSPCRIITPINPAITPTTRRTAPTAGRAATSRARQSGYRWEAFAARIEDSGEPLHQTRRFTHPISGHEFATRLFRPRDDLDHLAFVVVGRVRRGLVVDRHRRAA